MAIPAAIREAMDAEQQSMETVAQEIAGKGKFALDPDAPDHNQLTTDDEDEGQGFEDILANSSNDTQAGGDDTVAGGEDTQPAASGNDTPAAAAQTPATPAKPEKARNVFDLGLSEEDLIDPAPAAQAPAPAPRAPVARPAPVAAPAATAPAPVAGTPSPRAPAPLLTAAEAELIGGPQVAAVLEAALRRARAEDAQRIAQLEAAQEQTGGDLQATRVSNFRQNIEATVPQYNDIISSRAWQKFLGEYNPLAGGTIQQALLAADARFDRKAVTGIFEEFRRRYGPKDASDPNAPTPAKKGFENLAVPEKSARAQDPAAATTKRYKYKESDIARLDQARRSRQITTIQYQEKVRAYEDALAKGQVQLGA